MARGVAAWLVATIGVVWRHRRGGVASAKSAYQLNAHRRLAGCVAGGGIVAPINVARGVGWRIEALRLKRKRNMRGVSKRK